MDPVETLKKALFAIIDYSSAEDYDNRRRRIAREDSVEALRDLADWIERDGFVPKCDLVAHNTVKIFDL